MTNTDHVSPLIMIPWVLMCLAVWTFYWEASLEVKRRWHPKIVVATALVFLAFVAYVTPFALAVAVPAVAVISVLNWKMTKFCPSCGRTVVQNPPWVPINFCPKCGASLKQAGA